MPACSIHPQGWVPVETGVIGFVMCLAIRWVAFTPKGGCPLKPAPLPAEVGVEAHVAFTPKGGCPLKLLREPSVLLIRQHSSSIHPQGWVPVETYAVPEY